jgi:3-oxoacyl-[acyl-carrier-protein] synthase III
MPLPRADVDATTPKFLRDKYAIVGVGETDFTRGSNKTTRALATIAVRNAMRDAGLKPSEIDGMLSYQSNDSVFSPFVAGGRRIFSAGLQAVPGKGRETPA